MSSSNGRIKPTELVAVTRFEGDQHISHRYELWRHITQPSPVYSFTLVYHQKFHGEHLEHDTVLSRG